MSKDKTILITGASAGIGLATARALLARGYTVVAGARRTSRMQELVALGATAIKLDVTDDQDLTSSINQIERDHGGVDVLINNAGYGVYGALEDVSLEEARAQLDVNLFAIARLIQLVLPGMRRKKAGRIINMSSMGGKITTPMGGWYHASKFALEGYSDALRQEVASFGIDVVVIEPGVIETEFCDNIIDPLLLRSGDGAYAELARKMAAVMRKHFTDCASPAQVIADIVVKAVRARHPKTRYVAGNYAALMLCLRWLLPDRLFDWCVSQGAK